MLDICLLGTGGMLPLPHRHLTAVILRVEGRGVLIDCGEATQVALHRSSFSPAHIDDVLFTHYHGDHVSGLPGLLLTMANSQRREPVHLWGGRGLERIVRGLTVICGHLPFELVLHELPFGEGASFTTGPLEWQTCPVKHRVPCLAYRADLPRQGRFDPGAAKALGVPLPLWRKLQAGETVEVGQSEILPEAVMGPPRKGIRFAYATDCRPSPALVELVQGADLFIAEGLYGDDAKRRDAAAKGHMVYSEAATIARDAQVQALWLTHYSPAMIDPGEHLDRARAIFPNTHCGKDLKMVSLNYPEED